MLISGFASVKEARAQYVGQISAFIQDTRTGAVLGQVNPDLPRYPASLTKLMTLYMTFRALRAGAISLDQAVPVSIHAATREPSKLGLTPGSYLTVEQAILALVTKSANDAACALGEMIGGTEPQFAEMMTAEARHLGMSQTVFHNASGLPDPGQVTTARDLATLGRHLVLDFPEDYHYFSVGSFYFHGHMIPNHNPMLNYYPGTEGMKTGYTAQAGLNLVTTALRDNVRLVGVVMGARTGAERTITMADMLDRGFSDEGVAPVERDEPVFHPRPLILARAGRVRQRRMMMLAAAHSRRAPVQVAEAPVRSGHKALKSGMVRYVLAKAPLTHHGKAGTAHAKGAVHALKATHRSRA